MKQKWLNIPMFLSIKIICLCYIMLWQNWNSTCKTKELKMEKFDKSEGYGVTILI